MELLNASVIVVGVDSFGATLLVFLKTSNSAFYTNLKKISNSF